MEGSGRTRLYSQSEENFSFLHSHRFKSLSAITRGEALQRVGNALDRAAEDYCRCCSLRAEVTDFQNAKTPGRTDGKFRLAGRPVPVARHLAISPHKQEAPNKKSLVNTPGRDHENSPSNSFLKLTASRRCSATGSRRLHVVCQHNLSLNHSALG